MEQEPTSKEAQFWLVSALWDAGQGAAALQQLRKAVAAGSAGTPLINEVYGGLYVAQQAWEKAIRHYQRASEKDPHWPGAHQVDPEGNAHYLLGMVYRDTGRSVEARAMLQESRRIKAERFAEVKMVTVPEAKPCCSAAAYFRACWFRCLPPSRRL